MDEGDSTPDASWVQRLQDLRRLQGWSQRKLALELRVSAAAVSQWESGVRGIPGPVRRLIEIYEENIGMIEPPQGELTKLNGSWAARAMRASTTTARIAVRLAGSSLRSLVASNARAAEIKAATHQAIAREIAGTLGELKGGMLKLGQTASYMHFALPDDVKQALRPLQDSSPAVSAAAIEGVFRESVTLRPERFFHTWESKPFATGSIGQVHRATLADGTAVAVKVQYPGIRDIIQTDLANVAAVEKLTSLVFRRHQSEAIDEIRARFSDECDYRLEADHQEQFRRIHQGKPGVAIPKVFSKHSTDRILTMELMEGQSFASFVRTASQTERDRAGEIIFRVAIESIFKHRVFNADPHPGNYCFGEGGDVTFFDFGCVKRFSANMMRVWAQYARAMIEGRRADADELVIKQGFAVDREKYDFDYHHQMMLQVYEPLTSKQPFTFNRHYLEQMWATMVLHNPNRYRLHLPGDYVFVSRVQFGLYAVLAALEARADWAAIYDEATLAALESLRNT